MCWGEALVSGVVRAKEGSPSGLGSQGHGGQQGSMAGRHRPETPRLGCATAPERSPSFSACWKMMMIMLVEVTVMVTVTMVMVVVKTQARRIMLSTPQHGPSLCVYSLT